MIASSEFQHYLQSICSFCDYAKWWKHSALTVTEREQSELFDFDLQVKEVKPQQDRGTSSENPSDPIAEVAKHYLQDSVFAKALITYVDTMSADINQGE
jgi:hypothetical protein